MEIIQGFIVGFLTLTLLEIVLGIDNIIFISVISNRLPEHQRARARRIGIGLALISRLALLGMLFWLAHLTKPLFTVFELTVTARDLILLGGGLFLLYKATVEIHQTMEEAGESHKATEHASMFSVLSQIILLDIIFSLDSVITAIGLVDQLSIMIAAIIVAVIVMLFAAEGIARFIEQHPTVRMLALCMLLLVGVALIADGLHFHIPRGYIYFAVAFSTFVEMLNVTLRKPRKNE